jgi:preprotein translocase subunit YajC
VQVSAVATVAAGKSSSGGSSFILPLLLLVLVAFFFMSQRRRQRAAQQQRQTPLEPGSSVVTIGGLHGTVVAIDGSDVLLEVAPDTVLRFERRAIARIEPPDAAPADHDHSSDGHSSDDDSSDGDDPDGGGPDGELDGEDGHADGPKTPKTL